MNLWEKSGVRHNFAASLNYVQRHRADPDPKLRGMEMHGILTYRIMNRQEIITRINAFLEEDFEASPEALKPQASLKEALDLDSLDYIDLVVAIEQHFGFKVKPEDFQTMHTMDDFYNYVEGRMQTAG